MGAETMAMTARGTEPAFTEASTTLELGEDPVVTARRLASNKTG